MLLLGLIASSSAAIAQNSNLLQQLLASRPDLFGTVLQNPAKYEVQIIYTQIDRDKNNRPIFTDYTYRLDDKEYFYPASTVKLPAAIVALEKINRLNIKGLTRDTPLRIDSAFTGQTAVQRDSTAPNGLPTIGHYIKKILLVSDNDAYNRLYEFIGQKELNQSLQSKGFNLRIVHRLSVGDTPETARHTNPFVFYQGNRVIYQQPLASNDETYPNPLTTTRKGKGYISYKDNPSGELIAQPMDFSQKNYYPLSTMHQLLKTLIFPESALPSQRFQLTDEDYRFLYRYMSMYPKESKYPAYTDTCCNYDSYCKFFIFGDSKKPIPRHIRIFNKVGQAYGYLIDNAYIVDFKNKVEFMLSAVIHVNEDDILNDDVYEYDSIGFPFLANLGRVIYQYELQRKRPRKPDLSKFKFTY
ncbi:MAG: serine hydrolase [Cytophagales bacterium]|nr:class A beta-lactamase-related serine hydrolase [Bernardetiaceae bacterium]MDW8209668.1 serine hydrolase [Cytophagales bacterium]